MDKGIGILDQINRAFWKKKVKEEVTTNNDVQIEEGCFENVESIKAEYWDNLSKRTRKKEDQTMGNQESVGGNQNSQLYGKNTAHYSPRDPTTTIIGERKSSTLKQETVNDTAALSIPCDDTNYDTIHTYEQLKPISLLNNETDVNSELSKEAKKDETKLDKITTGNKNELEASSKPSNSEIETISTTQHDNNFQAVIPRLSLDIYEKDMKSEKTQSLEKPTSISIIDQSPISIEKKDASTNVQVEAVKAATDEINSFLSNANDICKLEKNSSEPSESKVTKQVNDDTVLKKKKIKVAKIVDEQTDSKKESSGAVSKSEVKRRHSKADPRSGASSPEYGHRRESAVISSLSFNSIQHTIQALSKDNSSNDVKKVPKVKKLGDDVLAVMKDSSTTDVLKEKVKVAPKINSSLQSKILKFGAPSVGAKIPVKPLITNNSLRDLPSHKVIGGYTIKETEPEQEPLTPKSKKKIKPRAPQPPSSTQSDSPKVKRVKGKAPLPPSASDALSDISSLNSVEVVLDEVIDISNINAKVDEGAIKSIPVKEGTATTSSVSLSNSKCVLNDQSDPSRTTVCKNNDIAAELNDADNFSNGNKESLLAKTNSSTQVSSIVKESSSKTIANAADIHHQTANVENAMKSISEVATIIESTEKISVSIENETVSKTNKNHTNSSDGIADLNKSSVDSVSEALSPIDATKTTLPMLTNVDLLPENSEQPVKNSSNGQVYKIIKQEDLAEKVKILNKTDTEETICKTSVEKNLVDISSRSTDETNPVKADSNAHNAQSFIHDKEIMNNKPSSSGVKTDSKIIVRQDTPDVLTNGVTENLKISSATDVPKASSVSKEIAHEHQQIKSTDMKQHSGSPREGLKETSNFEKANNSTEPISSNVVLTELSNSDSSKNSGKVEMIGEGTPNAAGLKSINKETEKISTISDNNKIVISEKGSTSDSNGKPDIPPKMRIVTQAPASFDGKLSKKNAIPEKNKPEMVISPATKSKVKANSSPQYENKEKIAKVQPVKADDAVLASNTGGIKKKGKASSNVEEIPITNSSAQNGIKNETAKIIASKEKDIPLLEVKQATTATADVGVSSKNVAPAVLNQASGATNAENPLHDLEDLKRMTYELQAVPASHETKSVSPNAESLMVIENISNKNEGLDIHEIEKNKSSRVCIDINSAHPEHVVVTSDLTQKNGHLENVSMNSESLSRGQSRSSPGKFENNISVDSDSTLEGSLSSERDISPFRIESSGSCPVPAITLNSSLTPRDADDFEEDYETPKPRRKMLNISNLKVDKRGESYAKKNSDIFVEKLCISPDRESMVRSQCDSPNSDSFHTPSPRQSEEPAVMYTSRGERVVRGEVVRQRSLSPDLFTPEGSPVSDFSDDSYDHYVASVDFSVRSDSVPRRVFPQHARPPSYSEDWKEPSPVVFDAGLSFDLCSRQTPVRQHLRPSPAHTEPNTISNSLSCRIAEFLSRTDHVMEEWNRIGRGDRSNILSCVEIPGKVGFKTIRSKSAANIMIKGFQYYSRGNSSAKSSWRSPSSSRYSVTSDRTLSDFDELSEMSADLTEERSCGSQAAQRLEAETAERIRLEQEVTQLNGKKHELQKSVEQMELELHYAKADLNGVYEVYDDGDDGPESDVYKQQNTRLMREVQLLRGRLQQQHEDDLEQLVGLKKQLEKKLADAYEEVDEQRQVVGQWKKKCQKLQAEINDQRLILEDQNSRNILLEKKQRKFDAELQSLHDELRSEKTVRDRLSREREVVVAEKFSLQQSLSSVRLELELKEEKLGGLTQELDELTAGGNTEQDLTFLRKAKHDLEKKVKDQEDELDDLAGQVSILESAKLKLEMSLESVRKENRKEITQKEEEIDDVRSNAIKKIKTLEAALEQEHEDRTMLLREKHELERKLNEQEEQGRHNRAVDEDVVTRLRKDLRKTKALLRDAQVTINRAKQDSPSKATLRALKNQLEDTEVARSSAVKAKQSLESELSEVSAQLDEANRGKSDAESRAQTFIRQSNTLRCQLDDNEEELAEVMKKYRANLQQVAIEQTKNQETAASLEELEAVNNSLREQIAQLSARIESSPAANPAGDLNQRRLEIRTKDLESRLELEATVRARLEVQITRLKENVERVTEERNQCRVKENVATEQVKKIQRSLRECKDELAIHVSREQETNQKRRDLEKKLEATERETATAKNDLRLSMQRVQDLQSALAAEINSDSDGSSDAESPDDSLMSASIESSRR